MAEETVVEVPVVATPEAKPEQDLITKVASFKPQVVQQSTDGVILDQKLIDSITDPKIKEAALNLHKSVQADYTRKTQAVAQTRKEVENQLVEMQTWTPEKVQKYLLNNPSFVQSAQAVAGGFNQPQGQEESSLLTEAEQKKLSLLETELQNLKQERFKAEVTQFDTQLQARYPDYNPSEIEEAMARLSKMSPTEIREYVYKAVRHDDHIKNAYGMREEELKQLNQVRAGAISTTGTSAVNNDGVPVKAKGESDVSFIGRLGQFRLQQLKK
jgi:hypothetical protein